MTRPSIQVDVDGSPVAGGFFSRLESLSVTDREGVGSDSISLSFDDSEPRIANPRRGAVIRVQLETAEGGSFTGEYIVDRVEWSCLPYRVSVSGHAADLRGEMKTARSRFWDDSSVGAIVGQIAGEHGLVARISESVASHVYDWIGQQDETDLHFLERLARRHRALFTIKNGRLMWLDRGAGQTAGGEALSQLMVTPADIIVGSCRVTEGDADRYKAVKAYWQDTGAQERQEVVVDADPDATAIKVLREPFSSQQEAEGAAASAASEITRGTVETSCSIVGRPSLMAGHPITYSDVRADVDGRKFILDTVTHSYRKAEGLRTTFTGKLQAGT